MNKDEMNKDEMIKSLNEEFPNSDFSLVDIENKDGINEPVFEVCFNDEDEVQTVKVLLVPNVTTLDLTKNKNILTSAVIKFANLASVLADVMKFDTVSLSEDNPDFIIAQYCSDDKLNELKKYNVPIYEFYFDGLNGGWFLERITIDGVTQDVLVETAPHTLNTNQELLDELGLKNFYRVVVNKNSDL